MRGVQTPTRQVLPSWSDNASDDIVELCEAYGLELDPWQATVLDGALGEKANGDWAAPSVGLSVPRQNGKTALFEARELAGLLVYDERTIIHSAHLYTTAAEAFQRIKGYFENFDDLRTKVRRIREANGEQGIEMKSGQRLLFKARSRSSGRGFSADCIMLDEAQELPTSTWAAMLPTISAGTNTQVWLAGTPPGPLDNGEVFERMRTSALSGDDRTVAWFEWTMEREDDLDAQSTWAKANPALGTRIKSEAIEKERLAMGDEDFARERLGFWLTGGEAAAIDTDAWDNLLQEAPSPEWPLMALGIDMNPERTQVTIATASASGEPGDGHYHLELAVDTAFSETGTSAVINWIWRRAGRRTPVVIDAYSPARDLLEVPLRRRGVDKNLHILQAGEYTQACSLLRQAVEVEHSITHYGQEQLDVSIAGATRSPLKRYPGAFKWGRSGLGASLAPLNATTGAYYGALKFGRRRGTATKKNRQSVAA